MKQVILIFLVVCACYGAWQLTPDHMRVTAREFARRHLVRLGLVFVALFLMFAAAVQSGTVQLF